MEFNPFSSMGRETKDPKFLKQLIRGDAEQGRETYLLLLISWAHGSLAASLQRALKQNSDKSGAEALSHLPALSLLPWPKVEGSRFSTLFVPVFLSIWKICLETCNLYTPGQEISHVANSSCLLSDLRWWAVLSLNFANLPTWPFLVCIFKLFPILENALLAFSTPGFNPLPQSLGYFFSFKNSLFFVFTEFREREDLKEDGLKSLTPYPSPVRLSLGRKSK